MTPFLMQTHAVTATLMAFCVLTLAAPSQAQNVRCTNAAGAVVAYAESAAYCPKDGAAAGASIAPASQPTTAQRAQAQQLASSNQKQGDALEAQRLKAERDQAKAASAATNAQAKQARNCKKKALDIEEAKAKVEDARMKALKKGATKAKPKSDKPGKSVTAYRVDDEIKDKAYQKAKRKLTLLEAKRGMDCK